MKRLLTTIACMLYLIQTFGQSQNSLTITPLSGDLYVYTTYKDLNSVMFPSNSMYLVTDIGVVLFDTPWDTTQCQPLLDSIRVRHNKDVIYSISTHYHDDRTACVDFLKENGVRTYSSKMTYDLCSEQNENQPEYYLIHDTNFVIGGQQFETYYPGEGHTKDNIVIWFEKEKVLYGGCLVKSVENQDLGNIADANLEEWGPTIQKVMKRYPDARIVVPGHFGWSGKEALIHTLELLENTQRTVR